NEVSEGVLRVQSSTALGFHVQGNPPVVVPGTTTVDAGAALEVAGYVPALNGYVAGGIQVQEALVLQGTGNVTADDPTHDFSNHANLVQVFTNVSDDNIWNGPITLANTNEIQKVTVTGLGGTYTLTFSDGTTSATTTALPVNATDAQVQAAL